MDILDIVVFNGKIGYFKNFDGHIRNFFKFLILQCKKASDKDFSPNVFR